MAFIYKSKNDENVLTIPHFQRLFDFHAYLMAYNNGQLYNQDCYKILGLCIYPYHLVDLYKDMTGNPVFPGAISTDAQLVTSVNTGINANIGSSVTVGSLFGGTTPNPIELDTATNQFNIQEAKAIKCAYFLNVG